jgi:7-cyano-7-deazaguanine synthase
MRSDGAGFSVRSRSSMPGKRSTMIKGSGPRKTSQRAVEPIAVLCSGGLDSAILLGVMLRQHARVFPIFVRCGLYWEKTELRFLRRYLRALRCDTLAPLTILDQPVADLYGPHWSITGQNVPGAETPDEAVFLPGRNLLLLSKTLLWCQLNQVPAVALGLLKSNPFPDATPVFFRELARVANRAVEGNVEIKCPFAGMKKKEVVRLGRDLPVQYSLSCLRPADGLHCGQCNKCAERRLAFAEAELPDPTKYSMSTQCA